MCLPHIFTLHRNKLKAFTRFIWLVVVKLTAEGDLTHTVSLYNCSPRSGDVAICHSVSHAGPLDPDHAAGPLVQTTGHLTPDVPGSGPDQGAGLLRAVRAGMMVGRCRVRPSIGG